MKQIFFLLLFSFLSLNIRAQIFDVSNVIWTEQESISTNESIKYYTSNSTIKNDKGEEIPFSAHCIVADLNDPSLQLRAVHNEKSIVPTAFYQKLGQKPEVIINGGYFGGDVPYSLAVDNHTILSDNIRTLNRDLGTYYPTRGAFGLQDNGQMIVDWIYSLTAKQEVVGYSIPSDNSIEKEPLPQPTATFPEEGKTWDMKTAIGGGPILRRNGVDIENYDPELFYDDIAKSYYVPRTAIGYTEDRKMIMMVVDGYIQDISYGITLPTMNELMKQWNCTDVLNLDGGGSTQMVLNGDIVNSPSDGWERKVPVVLTLSSTTTIIDTEDNRFNTLNATISEEHHHFGTSKSLLLDAGDSVTVSMKQVETAYYAVNAWSHNTENLSDNITFTLKHKNGKRSSFQHSQTTLNDGHFSFVCEADINAEDILIIKNESSTSKAIIDAIKLEYLRPSEVNISFENGNYGVHAIGETVKGNILIVSDNEGLVPDTFELIETENNTSILQQDITQSNEVIPFEYLVENEEGSRFDLVAKIIMADSSSKEDIYTINVKNNAPIIMFKDNDTEKTTSGSQGETIPSEIKVYASTATRPLSLFSIAKRNMPEGEMDVIDEIIFPNSLDSTFVYNYTLNENSENIQLQFTIIDSLDFSESIYLNVEDIDGIVTAIDPSLNGQIKYGPNPVVDYFTVKMIGNLSIHQWTLYSLHGQVINHQVLPTPRNEINYDWSTLQDGIYILKLMIDEREVNIKVIKK